jgi:hypothetical protein
LRFGSAAAHEQSRRSHPDFRLCRWRSCLCGYQVFRAGNARSYSSDTAFTEKERLTEFTSNGVRVVLFTESDSQGFPLLRATFTPTKHGFHLYSKDLDPTTTGGVGMPTRLELLPNPSSKGAIRYSATFRQWVSRSAEPNTTVEIYPDGPVSLASAGRVLPR